MKIPPAPHSWRLTPRQAIAVQRKLAGLVRVVSPLREPQRTRDTGFSVGKQTGRMTGGTHFRLVAGLDAAFSLDGQQCLAVVVLWDVTEREVIEQQTAVRKLTFPYIPGLLSFREAPALLGALRKLRRVPDVLMCDGQGIAHPRRLGIASHVGLVCGLPAVGCAKSRLIGRHVEPARWRGSGAPLMDGREHLGEVLRTQDGVRPVFVSAGHLCDLQTARELVLACATRYRLPEPTRLADRLVAVVKAQCTA